MQASQPAPPDPRISPIGGRPAAVSSQVWVLQGGLLLVLFVVYWLCVRRYVVYDGDMMIRVTKSLATQHSLRIQDPVFHVSEPYSYYGLAVSLLLLPLFELGQLIFHDGIVLLSTFEPLVTALTVVALLSLLVELGVSWQRSLTVSLLYAFGSLAWSYSGVLYSDQLVALMLTTGLLWALRYDATRQRRWALATGAALALALLARWDVALLLITPIGGFLVWRRFSGNFPPPLGEGQGGGRLALRDLLDGLAFAIPIILVIAVNVAYDILRYGRPLGGPYGTVVGFTTPLLTGLYGLLVSPGAGLLVFVPLVALAPFGLPALYRQRRSLAVLIVSLVLLRLFFYARWGDWDGGSSWGPRFMVPILPVLFVLIAFVPRRPVMRALVMALAALSITIELIGQLVPYGMYFTRAVAELSHNPAVVQACAGCDLGKRMEAMNQILDFDPRYAPLVGQIGMIRQGIIDPTWAHLAPVVPVLIAVLALVYVRLRRLAASLDRAPAEPRAAGPVATPRLKPATD